MQSNKVILIRIKAKPTLTTLPTSLTEDKEKNFEEFIELVVKEEHLIVIVDFNVQIAETEQGKITMDHRTQ